MICMHLICFNNHNPNWIFHSFVLVMELVGAKYRELISVLYQIPFNLGHLTLPLFAYYFRDWHDFQFALSIPSIILISYYWIIPESPRWLFTVGRIDESAAVLEKVAIHNKLPTESIKLNLEKHAINTKSTKTKEVSRGNIVDLVRTPNMRSKTICMCFNWLVCGMCFFGVAQYIGQIGGDIFMNVAISAVFELPGTILCMYTMKKFGRKWTLICSNTVAGVCMVLIAFVPSAQVVLATVALVSMSISFPTVYLYAGELFPTVVRNIGVGTGKFYSSTKYFHANFLHAQFYLPIHFHFSVNDCPNRFNGCTFCYLTESLEWNLSTVDLWHHSTDRCCASFTIARNSRVSLNTSLTQF